PFYPIVHLSTSPQSKTRKVRQNSFPTRRSSDLKKKLASKDDDQAILDKLIDKQFTIDKVNKRERKRNPAQPFITSSLQQEDVIKDRKSTRPNSSHVSISYAVFCLKKKKLKPTRNEVKLGRNTYVESHV